MPTSTFLTEGAEVERWKRINSFGASKIPQKHRVCSDCGKPFLSGIMLIERSYIVGAKCNKCVSLVENPQKPKKRV